MNAHLRYPLNLIAFTTYFSAVHPAVDIPYGVTCKDGMKYNDFVYASGDGRVTGNGWASDWGWYIWVEYDLNGQRVQVGNGHMAAKSEILIGFKVSAGQKIGIVGTTGKSTGKHDHIIVKVYRGGSWVRVNPIEWLYCCDGQEVGIKERATVLVYSDKPDETKKVIDISEFQSSVDFGKVKSDGVEGVIIRASWTGYGSKKSKNTDKEFESHYAGAIAAGLPVGVYHYSCAYTPEEAVVEADKVLSIIKGKQITYPVYIDIEDAHNTSEPGCATENQITIGKERLTKCAIAFCERIKAAGYTPGVYASLSWWYDYLIEDDLNRYEKWLAHYTEYPHPEYKDRFGIWQYTSTGKVSGISGNTDVNRCYKDYKPEPSVQLYDFAAYAMTKGDANTLKATADELGLRNEVVLSK